MEEKRRTGLQRGGRGVGRERVKRFRANEKEAEGLEGGDRRGWFDRETAIPLFFFFLIKCNSGKKKS